MVELGFVISSSDPSLFIYATGSVKLYLLLYVDGIIITGNSLEVVDQLISNLSFSFNMKDMGALYYFLGISITRSTSELTLSQSKYIVQLLEKFDMVGCKPVSSLAAATKLNKTDGELLQDPTVYRSIVGALQYITLTRPNIAFSVNQVYQFLQEPTTIHMIAVKRILQFLKGTLPFGLTFTPSPIELSAYCDADWAGCPVDKRSTNGYCVYLGKNPISWCAKKQSVLARSSTEAKCRCIVHTIAELYWLCSLLLELDIPLDKASVIYCDNVSAISLSLNLVFHARMKHIEVDYHFVREKIARKQIVLKYVSTKDQVADIFT